MYVNAHKCKLSVRKRKVLQLCMNIPKRRVNVIYYEVYATHLRERKHLHTFLYYILHINVVYIYIHLYYIYLHSYTWTLHLEI